MAKKREGISEKLTQDQLKELIPYVEENLNRNGHTVQNIAQEKGTNEKMIFRIASFLRKAGREIPRSRYGLKKLVEEHVNAK